MSRQLSVFNIVSLIASLPFLYFIITDKEPNWLYYLSLTILLGSAVVSMIFDWRAGKRKAVKVRVFTYVGIIAVCLLLALIFPK